MIFGDEPPPLFEYINDLEARIERLEKRIEKLEEEAYSNVPGVKQYNSNSGNTNNDKCDSCDGMDSSTGLKVEANDKIEVIATFYTAQCAGCSGITKTGYDVKQTIYSESGRRIIAVDPSFIPLGSIVRVKLEDGQEFEAEALDVGGSIKGARIDVLVETREEAFRLGKQSAKAEIIKEGSR